ncbi:hypothetical protein EST38_g9562 [Candolleomyces aberdarensis]|uniref:Uncharacterized protein n=1 Tax=Candolleomyces aberdarensis TaxID=2316362 RepID=A0A4Q2DBS8_9AGAR|nr:hypothetical protein EST38_g9562 [Candolleomyces aberdarensis]
MSGRTRSVNPRAASSTLAARSVDCENSPPSLRVSPGSKKTSAKSTSANAKPSLNAAPRRPSRTTTATALSATQTIGSLATARRKSAPAAILGGSSLSNQQQKKVGRSFSGSPILKQGGGAKGTQVAEEFDSEGNKENVPPFRLVSLGSPPSARRNGATGARFYSSTYPIRASVPETLKEKLGLQVAAPAHIIKLPRGEDRGRHEEKGPLEKKPGKEEVPLVPAKASEGLLKVVQSRSESDDSGDSDSDSASEGADVVEVSDSSEDSESDDGRDDCSE